MKNYPFPKGEETLDFVRLNPPKNITKPVKHLNSSNSKPKINLTLQSSDNILKKCCLMSSMEIGLTLKTEILTHYF